MALTDKEQERIRGLDTEAFEAEWTKAAQELEELKERLKFYSQDSQARAAEERASQLAATLSDAEKLALVQAVQAEGIESQEKGMGDL